MSTNRINPKAGFVGTTPRGPNGRPTCRRCGDEVPKGRRSWCGDTCVDAHRMTTDPGFVRHKVFERDRGVCARCGMDTVEQARQIADMSREEMLLAMRAARIDTLRRFSPWDADHIKPVAEGGGECGLENYQTLCQRCHKGKTADQATDAKFRREWDAAVRSGEARQLNLLMDTDPLGE